MAENTRIRIEPDIEQYLKSQSERVLGKASDNVSTADLTTLTNRIIYEHRQAHQLMALIPITRIFNWITSLNPGSKVVNLPTASDQPKLQPSKVEDFDFDADLADKFEEAA
ncbi:MAG: hypothetical protein DSM106950_41440 [Stigonema ocellatum SAG 48.90 = DSM 106950]|nr:hypothetical protein [Stigonema ocellatum SAG 48.90 = DSM 106950]